MKPLHITRSRKSGYTRKRENKLMTEKATEAPGAAARLDTASRAAYQMKRSLGALIDALRPRALPENWHRASPCAPELRVPEIVAIPVMTRAWDHFRGMQSKATKSSGLPEHAGPLGR